MADAEQKAEITRADREASILSETTMNMDLSGEKEKIQFALELAIHEATKKSKHAAADEGEDLDETTTKAKPIKKKEKGYLGTSTMLKLPFVIGTPEYQQHPFAGLVYLGTGHPEQQLLHEDEQQQLAEDKKKEKEELKRNA